MAERMTKSQIVAHFAEKLEMPKATVAEFLDAYATLATGQAKKVGEFTLPGIGKLVKQQRAARVGRNPATGEEIKIPSKTVVKMRLAKACKDAVIPPKK